MEGFELGIQRAFGVQSEDERLQVETDSGGDNSKKLQRTATCIGYSEIDKYAIKVYERQFNGKNGEGSGRPRQKENISVGRNPDPSSEPNERQHTKGITNGGHKNYGDATKINAKELPDFDLLVGGFPCQSFSVAGKRKGFDDTRGTLFFDIARILSEKRPQHLVLENVKGLLSHGKGKTFQTILGVLSDLGYRVEWQVLNSKNFGVPQNRERIFVIGHLRGECGRKVFPITGTDTEDIGQFVDLTIGNNSKTTKQSRTLQARYFKGYSKRPAETSGVIKQLNQPTHSNDRVYSDTGISPTLNTMQGGNRQPFVAPVLTPNRKEKRQNGRRIKEDGEPSFTLTGQDQHGVQLDTRIRRLTPLECERLQGFPDNWTIEGVEPQTLPNGVLTRKRVEISDTQRYKMCGNAVTVNVIEAIMRKFSCL